MSRPDWWDDTTPEGPDEMPSRSDLEDDGWSAGQPSDPREVSRADQ